jgi:hypothetical protein
MTKRKNTSGVPMCNRGSLNAAAKLTERDIPVIRHRLSQGETQVNIARSYGVSASAIGLIQHGKNWNWI